MSSPEPAVLHLLSEAGGYSEIWLDAQITGTDRYRSVAWRQRGELTPYRWVSRAAHVSEALPHAELAVRLWRTDRFAGSLRRSSALPATLAGLRLRDRPRVIHAHYGTVAWEWLGLVRNWEIPLVASFYGFDASKREHRSPPWPTRYRMLFERTSAVIVEGPAMARRVEEMGCDPAKLHLLRLPFANVNLPIVDRAASHDWAAIMAGRFVEKKGFAVGLAAFAKAVPEGRLALVGSGPLEELLRRQVKELGLTPRVDFMAPVPLPDLARLFSRSRIALFPSHSADDGDGEGGAPLTLTLAQAVGTRIVVTDHDDLPWASAPGTPVVPANDVGAFGGALARINAADETYDAQVERARQFVAREHDAHHLIRARESIYDSVTSS